MCNNQYKASITLCLTMIGLLFSALFYDSFSGAMLTAGFSAATIGGIADWFAVNALFRKPLGIRYKTEILPRKREKIFNDIVDMVQNTLLSKENMKKQLTRYSMPHLILRYLEQNQGKEDLKILISQILKDAIHNINPVELEQLLKNIVKNKTFIRPLLRHSIRFLSQTGYDDKIIVFLITEIKRIVAQPQIKDLMVQILITAQKTYEEDASWRKITNYFFGQFGYTPDKLGLIAQKKMLAFLDHLASHPPKHHVKTLMIKLVSALETNEGLKNWLIAQLRKKATSLPEILITHTADSGKLLLYITKRIDKSIDAFKHNPDQQQTADDLIKKIIIHFIDSYHAQIGTLVLNNLNQYTNESLVTMIEAKVGDDLQMIRINGAVVGGIAGTALFLLTCWL